MNVWVVLIGAIAAVAALGVITARHALYSALSLVLTICAISVLYLMLNAQFLFVVQLIVYAGAVMVLFVFIIALLNPAHEVRPKVDWHLGLSLIAAGALSVAMWVIGGNGVTYSGGFMHAVIASEITAPTSPSSIVNTPGSFAYTVQAVNANGNIQTVAGQLFTTYLLPFEVTSLLLLIAAIGAVYLTRHHRSAA